MKLIVGTAFAVTLIVMVLSVGLVSALEQNEASIIATMPGDQRVRGEFSSVHIQFTSQTEKTLAIYYVGIHFDWMDKDQLYGIDFSNNPKTVEAMKSVVIDIINYTVPTDASFGAHTYYIGVDGYDEDAKPFSWTSDEATIQVVTTQTSNQPTSTAATNPDQQPFDMNLVIGAVIIGAVVVIAVVILAFRKPKANNPPKDNANQESPKPEQKPDESPSQDFNI
jgi:hypothetical protein